MFQRRGEQFPHSRTSRWLNFLWWCLIFVGLKYGSCFMPPFWQPEFWGFCKIYATLFQRLSLARSPSSGQREERSWSSCSHEIELIGIGFLLHFYLRMMTASVTHYVVFTHTVDTVNCCCSMPLWNYRMVPKLNVHPLTENSLRWQEILIIWANERY